ncbi:MAG: phosphatidylglycerophosphatase A [Candidatus Omnitrophota bacterium]|nr:phosphatidylglycerophosphatase A [Candidatus Omnitrophota bacterium]MBU1929552.1 phosphatidylglycerophosphatase A [Candidatus Omnitrophota bacterium]MBU2035796.1 phosphatidylglycerophosphatase A [Candidatus Omnitrophota bacterium]MBU2221651.1 phosphatidylglycerophosphatase A [Candidatus Omnitrophota bacterium]MBU2258917.1 phosphatidylglycerophosphatase A [Candidatus Omnitrophota bacterium]
MNRKTAVNFLSEIITTFFFIGYIPVISGTFASLIAVAIYFVLEAYPFGLAIVTLTVLILGFLFCGRAEKALAKKDPSCIVIDEVSGMLLSLAFLPYNWGMVLAAFILFRALDIFKPFPISKFQKMNGSLGIMGDDILAGIFTNIILQIVLRFTSFNIS